MRPARGKRTPARQPFGPAFPASGTNRRFTPDDFFEVIAQLPEGCPVVGGQAVAWWAAKYGVRPGSQTEPEPITSADIDFWGSRDDLNQMARALGRKPIFPHEYEMTVWVGAIPLSLHGQKSLAEFLHTIPGLDTNDPDLASVEQEYKSEAVHKLIQVLTPVSLVLSKLHALRHFDQTNRQDELHLKVSLQTSSRFITHLLEQNAVREGLWNCERLIAVRQSKHCLKLERLYKFNVLSAIPVAAMGQAANEASRTTEDRQRLRHFLELRWNRLLASEAHPSGT